jgi:hypothetical protein
VRSTGATWSAGTAGAASAATRVHGPCPPSWRPALVSPSLLWMGRCHRRRWGDVIVAQHPIATGVIEGACRHLIKDAWTSRAPAGVCKAQKPCSRRCLVRPVFHRVDPDLLANADDQLRRAWLDCDRAIDQALAQARSPLDRIKHLELQAPPDQFIETIRQSFVEKDVSMARHQRGGLLDGDPFEQPILVAATIADEPPEGGANPKTRANPEELEQESHG